MTVYVCLIHYDYEGSVLDGVYTSKKAAEKHPWSGSGDGTTIKSWRINAKGIGRQVLEPPLKKKAKR